MDCIINISLNLSGLRLRYTFSLCSIDCFYFKIIAVLIMQHYKLLYVVVMYCQWSDVLKHGHQTAIVSPDVGVA